LKIATKIITIAHMLPLIMLISETGFPTYCKKL
jgi:hypothetical protein